jgi:hypothetical protein
VNQFLFCLVCISLLGLGAAMAIRPTSVILQSRDADEEARAPSTTEIVITRLVGMAIVAASGFGLYALLVNLPGAEFFPV